MDGCDALIVGGGFYGLFLADRLAARGLRVIVCEREAAAMTRASYANQARIHNGYHYPRSYLTALRSHANYPRFVDEFAACVGEPHVNIYAVSRQFSKVSAAQFRRAMERIGAPLSPLPGHFRGIFDPGRVADAFLTTEAVFDAGKLRDVMVARLQRAGVTVTLQTSVERIEHDGGHLRTIVSRDGGESAIVSRHVFSCAYAGINRVLRRSGLPPVAFKHELTEMALVELPPPLHVVGITVMCGAFFSCMPFPPRGLHTLSHVRYTPHAEWQDGPGLPEPPPVDRSGHATAFPHMRRDAARYVPALNDAVYRDSLWEIKTLLPRNEVDDGRPILFRRDHGLAGHHVIMGGKIDNVYDMETELERMFA